MIMLWITLIFLIILILISFINHKRHSVLGEKFKIWDTPKRGVLQFIFALTIFIGAKELYKQIIPFNKNHGVEFNEERKQLGLPILSENWISYRTYGQFEISWWYKPKPNGLVKKKIIYGYFGPKYELNSYKKEKNGRIFITSSRYNFKTETFDYWIGDGMNLLEIDNDGEFENWKGYDTKEINKDEFENLIEISNE